MEVEAWTDNSLHSASVGSNPIEVWCIDRSVISSSKSNIPLPTSGPFRDIYNIDEQKKGLVTKHSQSKFEIGQSMWGG